MNDRTDHDGGYKYLFSNKMIFHQFLTRFIDVKEVKQVKLDDIVPVESDHFSVPPTHFIHRASDSIYKISIDGRQAYVITEFQSTVDKTMPTRLLSYIAMFYERLARNDRHVKLPSVLSIVIYNGKDPWTVPTSFIDLIDQSIPVAYLTSFRYYLLDESTISEQQAARLKGAYAAMILANRSKRRGRLCGQYQPIYRLDRRRQSGGI